MHQAVFHGGGDLGERMRALNWSGTAIGDVSGWPAQLKTLVNVMLGAKQPMFTVWGPGLTLLYNDAYRAILGHKDRDALGRSFLDVWAEARSDLMPLVERAFAGEPVHMDDIMLVVDREGLAPEAHFAFSYTPIRSEDAVVRGFFCACSETTDHILAGKRQAFRLELEEALRGLEDANAIVTIAVKALGRHLKASRVGYGEVQPNDRTVLLASAYCDGVSPLWGTYDLDDFGAGAIAQQRLGHPVMVADIRAQTSSYDIELFREIETRAFISAPILRGGRLRATLFVNQREPRHWSIEDVRLIETVASRVADAVERVRAEADVRAHEVRFRTLTEAIPNQVWTATPAGVVDWVNALTHRYAGDVGITGEGLDWTALVHPDDLGLVSERWAASLEAGTIYEVEFRIRRADGAYRWHLVRALPQYDTTEIITRWVGTNTDIDDQKRAELELAAAKHAAEEANLAKSTFIANMSHELRTPLSAIIGYSEMMLEEIDEVGDDLGLAADMRKIEGNARHLLGLINDVLDLSKVESGKMDIYVEDFAIDAVVRELATTVGSLVAKKENRLVLDIGPELGTMRSDLTKVRQILLNLLSNAAKFAEGGTITLSAARDRDEAGDGCVVFTVVDTGIGMTKEQAAKLFQRFQQADNSTTRKFGGTGLGLSLVKAFADMLGGTIAVASTSGKGSTFTVSLPLTYVPPEKVDLSSEPDPITREDDGRDLVLVIDDDADQRTLMTRFLHREGFRVQVAADGRMGLALARQYRPRAILLDVMMPGIDGWSVLSEIKADPALSLTPVVMVTQIDQRSLAASLGAADYMLKPINWERFGKVVDRFRSAEAGARGHVLLVEDDAVIRLEMRATLEEAGWSVIEAENGKQGLARAIAMPPQMVLVDLNMPVLDGFAFLNELRTVPGCATVPVVITTGRELTREDRRLLRGASQILNRGDLGLSGLADRLSRLALRSPS